MKKECVFCAGTGQVTYFKGVSRFLLSSDECDECGGLGFLLIDEKKIEKNKKKLTKKADQKKKKAVK